MLQLERVWNRSSFTGLPCTSLSQDLVLMLQQSSTILFKHLAAFASQLFSQELFSSNLEACSGFYKLTLEKCCLMLLWRVPFEVFLYYIGGLELLLFTACLNLIFRARNSYAVFSQNSEQYFIRFLGWLYGLVKPLTTHFPKARGFIRESLQGSEILILRTLKLLELFFH